MNLLHQKTIRHFNTCTVKQTYVHFLHYQYTNGIGCVIVSVIASSVV